MHPDLALLTGDGAHDLLAAALATADAELVSWQVHHVDHRPESSTTVCYAAAVRDAHGERSTTLAASTGLRGPVKLPAGVLRLSDGEREIAVWRFPQDPGLPELATACDRGAVRSLLARYNLDAPEVRLRVRSYRPRRRAVIEVQAGRRRLFLKVLRPHAVEAMHARHRMLTDAGVPAPRSLGWTEGGLLVLEGLAGTSLRAHIRAGAHEAPSGEALITTLDRLPAEVCELPRRRAWAEECLHYAQVVGSALPVAAVRSRQLAERVLSLLPIGAGDDPTHGDFYETQLLLQGSQISGLLDVDTAGPGRRADDLACLLAHLDVLAEMEPLHRESSAALGRRWLRAFDAVVDPVDLRARVAGVVLSLATGPHRVQQEGWPDAMVRRLDVAEQWVQRAEQRRVAVG